jgi:hypothetical protein
MTNDSPRSHPAQPVQAEGTEPSSRIVLDDVAISRALMRIAHEIVERN